MTQDEKRIMLEKRLKETKKKLIIVDKKIKSGSGDEELKILFKELYEQRRIAEDELIDLVVETEEDFRTEAWSGLKKGVFTTLKSIEKSLKKNIGSHETIDHNKAIASSWIYKLTTNKFVAWGSIILMVYILLLAVGSLGSGFKWLSGGPEEAQNLFAFATNPFMGLIVGMLATALIQSSSTTTSIIVALCAGGLPIASAIPMIMGANIGTTVTNSLVSLGHIGNSKEFKRAFAAATVHDFFNVLAVIIFLPLELIFHPLEKTSFYLSNLLLGGTSFNVKELNFIKPITKPVINFVKHLFASMPFGDKVSASLFIIFGIGLIFISILFLGKLLRIMMVGKAEKIFHTAVGRSSLSGISTGALVTVLVQSSSTTTSLIVPLAGSGVMALEEVYPFTLGANIGTCITSLMAAMAITGVGAVAALQVGLIHLLYNTFAVILIYSLVFLRKIPLICARLLSEIASERKSLAIAYILVIFFIIPGLCLAVSNSLNKKENHNKTVAICPQCTNDNKIVIICPRCTNIFNFGAAQISKEVEVDIIKTK